MSEPLGTPAVASRLLPPTGADVVVVGTGVAGLTAALSLPGHRVLLLSKSPLGAGGSSPWAQGGVAAAIGAGDSPHLHAADTLAAAAGTADPEAVRRLALHGAAAIRRLIALGAQLDRAADGSLALGREAAHSVARIVHAGGDATGAELVRTLAAAVRRAPWITVMEGVAVEELLVGDGVVVGLLARERRGVRAVAAGAVVLATGGLGQLYRYTTNPAECTGDGLAMAARAGAALADLEFVQFHPTALAVGEDPLPLLTEALRGEGARVVDGRGRRILLAVHPLAELAPRDVVARAIWAERQAGREVFLDAREAVGERFPQRFPSVFRRCRELGLDPRRELLPVVPAAHYHMGGIAVDLDGRTSLPGLWACGEAASTGVHGANRLASNSLLEGLVFGEKLASAVGEEGRARPDGQAVWRLARQAVRPPARQGDAAAARRRLRQLMWDHVGLERNGPGLEGALYELAALATAHGETAGEVRNLLTAGLLVTAAALRREESRGGHFRADYPHADPRWHRRSVATAGELAAAWTQGHERPAAPRAGALA
ncbi:MAG TPA: L-aspartate oxidase [Thermoanaerobaculia bacterium]|nr:L-aspartate oxidase [Thermoanaerobaculia bacterium]